MVRDCLALLLTGIVMSSVAADPERPTRPLPVSSPLTPEQEKSTFVIHPGFDIQLVASEPNVIDPVAMCFDERGRIFVCEMRGYPNGGVGTGEEKRGRVRLLVDADGDGVYETASTFAEGLRFPMGVIPWQTGVIVAVAPDIIYLPDDNDDGIADRVIRLYTGFNLANIQQMVNGLTWGMDNWIYGIGGSNAGTIRSVEKPEMPAVTLQSRGFRFRPDVPGSLEPTSGGGQYGLTQDDAGNWFTATNSNNIRQIVIPDHYFQRAPSVPITAVTADISDDGTSCRLFRISPFEAWRVERTARRANSPEASRFRSTELVAGGYSSSTCSPLIYRADLFPERFYQNYFVCDPGNNVIHRKRLELQNAATFLARRADQNREFLASVDNWFRPVDLKLGPDGAIYVLDFYREVIETPLSLPDDIKAKLNLESRDRGRIWRIAPTGFQPHSQPNLRERTTGQLVGLLRNTNACLRMTVQRLLYQRRDSAAVPELLAAFPKSEGQPWRANLLTCLAEDGKLSEDLLVKALTDPRSSNRRWAIRCAETIPAPSERLITALIALADDPDAQVRFQLALTLSVIASERSGAALARILQHSASDPWTQAAVLIASNHKPIPLLTALIESQSASKNLRPFVTKLATLAVRSGKQADADSLLRYLARYLSPDGTTLSTGAFEGILQAMRSTKPSFRDWLTSLVAADTTVAEFYHRYFQTMAAHATDPKQPLSQRLYATGILAEGQPDRVQAVIARLLAPVEPTALQVAAVRALGQLGTQEATDDILANWASFAPSVRREAIEQLLARTPSTLRLLDAMASRTIAVTEIDRGRWTVLANSAHPEIRQKVKQLIRLGPSESKQKILTSYWSEEDKAGDPSRGKQIFQKNCASCHRLGDVGHDVGQNLYAAIPGKSYRDLVQAILDPNKEIDTKYMNYLLTTLDGKVVSGIIVADTPSSLTLRRAEGIEETIARTDIESLKSTQLSLMPEGFEKTITPSEMPDLIAFLREAVKIPPHVPK